MTTPEPYWQADAGQRHLVAEQALVQAERQPTPAFLLCIFLGAFGAHRFYLNRKGTALAMLLLTTVGWLVLIGPLISAVWAIVDLFLIKGMIRQENTRLRTEIYARFGLMHVVDQAPPQVQAPPQMQALPQGQSPGEPFTAPAQDAPQWPERPATERPRGRHAQGGTR
jgi:TM2 domain-containing membrane protein YozV